MAGEETDSDRDTVASSTSKGHVGDTVGTQAGTLKDAKAGLT